MSERLPPSSRRLRRMASDLENELSESRAEQLAARAVVRGRARHHRNRRHVAVVVGLASLMFVLVGLGYGSSKSLPGDPLYGVSRAYEGVGQMVGVVNPLEQRLHEVIALAERGDRVRAVQVASEALEELGRSADIALVSTATSTTTTTSTTTPESQDTAAPAVVPDDTSDTPDTTAAPDAPDTTETPPTAESGETDSSEGTDEVSEDDPIENLKVAAQLLLNRVREDGGELDDAAADLAVAVSALAEEEEEEAAAEEEKEEEEETTTSTSTSTTTTTEPEETSTSTTQPDSTSSSTTSTTVPEDEPGEEDTEPAEDEGPGPIIMPPEF